MVRFTLFWGVGFRICMQKGSFFLSGVMWVKFINSRNPNVPEVGV